MNMQKALALQIQEVTQDLRLQQKSLLENLNRFQSSKKNPFDFSYEDNYVKQSDSKHLQQFETQVLPGITGYKLWLIDEGWDLRAGKHREYRKG